MSRPPVIAIAGYKKAGKTTLVERLVAAFTARGLTVSTVKHAHHSVDLDQPGRDSHRHRVAGAREVAVVTSARWAIMHELGGAPEPSLGEIVARLSPADLVIAEGFKAADVAKIEVRRAGAGQPPLEGEVTGLIAIASDGPVPGTTLPVLALDDTEAICDFIASHFALERADARALT